MDQIIAPDNITPDVARHVLHHFRAEGGQEPGTFTSLLLQTIAHADLENRSRLESAFPNHVRAFRLGAETQGGIGALQQIAGVR